MDISKCVQDIEQLALLAPDTTIRVLAIFALAIHDSDYPVLANIYHNPREPTIIRTTAFLAPLSSALIKTMEKKAVLEILQQVHKMRKFAGEVEIEDSAFRSAVYWLLVLWGNLPKDYLQKERDVVLRANILMELRLPSLNTIIGAEERDLQRLNLATDNLDHPHPKMRKHAHITYMVHAPEEKREEMYDRVRTKSPYDVARTGTAIGFYSIVYSRIIASLPMATRFRLGSLEEKYAQYIQELSAVSPRRAASLLPHLDRAIELYPHPRFFYERALLKTACGRLASVREDLERAVELASENLRYALELLKKCDPEKEKQRFLEVQEKIVDGSFSPETLHSLMDTVVSVFSNADVAQQSGIDVEAIGVRFCLARPEIPMSYVSMARLLKAKHDRYYVRYLVYGLRRCRSSSIHLEKDVKKLFFSSEKKWAKFCTNVEDE